MSEKENKAFKNLLFAPASSPCFHHPLSIRPNANVIHTSYSISLMYKYIFFPPYSFHTNANILLWWVMKQARKWPWIFYALGGRVSTNVVTILATSATAVVVCIRLKAETGLIVVCIPFKIRDWTYCCLYFAQNQREDLYPELLSGSRLVLSWFSLFIIRCCDFFIY